MLPFPLEKQQMKPFELVRAYVCEDPFNFDEQPQTFLRKEIGKAKQDKDRAKPMCSPSTSPLRGDKCEEMHKTIGLLATLECKTQSSVGAVLAYNYAFLGNVGSMQELLDRGFVSIERHATEKGAPPNPDFNMIKPHHLVRYLTAAVELFRKMPVTFLLDAKDQNCLVNLTALAVVDFVGRFESVANNASVFSGPDGTPLQFFRTQPPFCDDQVTQMYANTLFLNSMQAFCRTQLCREEFLLLRAIILSHYAVTGLSAKGRKLLHAEMERYGATLMLFERTKHGEVGGTKRYAEVLQLVNISFTMAHKMREFHNYIDVVLDQGTLRSTLPQMFRAMCFDGADT